MLSRTQYRPPVQVRTMLGQKPLNCIIRPGRHYRIDPLDATHTL